MNTLSKPIGRTASGQKSWTRVVSIAVLAIAVLAFVVYTSISAAAADRLSRPERRAVVGTPADYGLAYERVSFESAVDHIPLAGWYLDSPGSKVIAILHGRNAVRNDPDAHALQVAQALVRHKYDVLMFDFRAHGESGGERYSMGGLEVRDIAGALAYLKTRGVTEIGALGFSMGGATLLNAAPDLPEIRALVSDSAFADVNLVVQDRLPTDGNLPSFFAPGLTVMLQVFYGIDVSNNQPQRQVARLGSRPLLLIHGTADDLIPISHNYALQKAAVSNPNLQVWIVPGAGHTKAYEKNPDEYVNRMIAFYDTHLN